MVTSGQPADVLPQLFREWGTNYISFEEDPEPYGQVRDKNIVAMCQVKVWPNLDSECQCGQFWGQVKVWLDLGLGKSVTSSGKYLAVWPLPGMRLFLVV